MEFALLILMLSLGAVFFTVSGLDSRPETVAKETREETIIFCNQKPQECKKEFELYQLKKEVEKFKMKELK